jgi:hypothetical protein
LPITEEEVSYEQMFDADYARLIHVGINNRDAVLQEHGAIADGVVTRWASEVAEPWWQAMRERAARDGIPIKCFRGGDPHLLSHGIETHIAAACLLSPNGERYKVINWQHTAEALRAIDQDWGETLAAARERHPYEFALGERRPAAAKTPRRILHRAIEHWRR